jgi:phospholipase/carboxylesterase
MRHVSRLAAMFLAIAAMGSAQTEPRIITNAKSGLRTWEVGSGSTPYLLLHGYSSSPRDWLPFTATVHLPNGGRFIFPEGPEETKPPDGPIGGRAWWRFDLASYRPRGEALPELSRAAPEGLARSARTVRTLIAEVRDRSRSRPDDTVLGGFSQGAIVSTEIAFRSDEPMRALIILSGNFVDESAWTPGMPARRGLPVFIAHGRHDDVLRFESAERLATAMKQAGLRVTWVPFDGAHEIPASVVTELNRFLTLVSN